MAEFDLVPSRRESILKMAGIVSSGIFAGLSMIVPGLSFAGFSLYGFSPMIKHLGGKIEGQQGATTIMRATINNMRRSEEKAFLQNLRNLQDAKRSWVSSLWKQNIKRSAIDAELKDLL